MSMRDQIKKNIIEAISNWIQAEIKIVQTKRSPPEAIPTTPTTSSTTGRRRSAS